MKCTDNGLKYVCLVNNYSTAGQECLLSLSENGLNMSQWPCAYIWYVSDNFENALERFYKLLKLYILIEKLYHYLFHINEVLLNIWNNSWIS